MLPLKDINLLLDKLSEFLIAFHPLINSHLVQFLSESQWETILSPKIKSDLLSVIEEDLHLIPVSGYGENEIVQKEHENELNSSLLNLMSMQRNLQLKNVGLLNQDLKFRSSPNIDPILIEANKKRMNIKKSHEILKMSTLVADLCNKYSIDLVIDAGCGLGYLSSSLAIHHELNILAIDSSFLNIQNTLKRSNEVDLEWQIMNRKHDRFKTKYEMIKEMEKGVTVKNRESCMSFRRYDGRLVGVTMFLNSKGNLIELINQSFNNLGITDKTEPKRLALVGLHTCGNLASTCVQAFVSNSSAEVLCIVPCCYHLLQEEFPIDSADSNYFSNKKSLKKHSDQRYHCATLDPYLIGSSQSQNGFPLSSNLRKKKLTLGRNARMLATNAPRRLQTDIHSQFPESLFWRAVFEVLVSDHSGKKCLQIQIKRGVAEKSSDFITYCQKAIKSLNLEIEISDEEILNYYRKYESEKEKFKRFFLLKSSFGSTIETLILLDKLAYLREQNVTDSYIVKLFDDVISPRCYAILSFKE